jgi:hypothetical protein
MNSRGKGRPERWTAASSQSLRGLSDDTLQTHSGSAFDAVLADLNTTCVYGPITPNDDPSVSTFPSTISLPRCFASPDRDDLLDATHQSEGDCRYLEKLLVERTIPVLSAIFPREDPCLRWTGALDRDGYARHRVPASMEGRGLSNVVSRFVYQLAFSIPLPQDYWTVDHACGNTACINPNHLRLLTRGLNKSLGDPRRL